MNRDDTALLVVDVQKKLMPAIRRRRRVVWNIRRLIDGARILGLPAAATEQYPKGLGPTVEQLAQHLAPPSEKIAFSGRGCREIFEPWRRRGIYKILVAGVESHVCVQQTVLDSLADGFRVFVPVDAVGSRHRLDCQTSLRRMDSAGAVLTTTEAALFEWCERADAAEFKQISELVREEPPHRS